MIAFEAAYRIVLENYTSFGEETVPLQESLGKLLAEAIVADRDFPPYDRSTRDGIAIRYTDSQAGASSLPIQGIAYAGEPQMQLQNDGACIEIMTGAILPSGTDTVVMYEHLKIEKGYATLMQPVLNGQNIHKKGSDTQKGAVVLEKGTTIGPAAIGVLAAVGKTEVLVKKLPKIAIVSTGNELVPPEASPEPHQIRTSNSFTLAAALKKEQITGTLFHFSDDKERIRTGLEQVVRGFDVILVSGGVSKGKYDFLPTVLESLGVDQLFHRVKQRPGKPFWFGKHQAMRTTIFAFPGNPGSTFANYHVYFLPWLCKSLGVQINRPHIRLNEAFENNTDLTRFIRVNAYLNSNELCANLVKANGSGDLTSLVTTSGFTILPPNTKYEGGELLPFIPTEKIFHQ
ncbi:MAG: molybdopterin molybdotransferase MoeA [Bacteroidota bacterium]